jgi:chromosome segregation ATPase
MKRLLPYVLFLAAVAAGVGWWRAETARRGTAERLAALERERGARPAAAAETAAPAAAAEPVKVAMEPRVVRVPGGADPGPYLKTIDELREQLREQARELSAAREAAARAEAGTAAEVLEGKKVKAQAEELGEDLRAARRVAEALQAELRVKTERLVKAETAEKLAQERAGKAEAAAVRTAAGSKEVEELNRRREGYLTTILRRYREVNDLYRNFTLNVQTREAAGPGLQAGDLSRIQSAIQQAEDELRQLQTLNARMAQLARAK